VSFLTLKKQQQQQTANALLLLLPHFYTYFSFQTLQFLLVGAQKYFLLQGAAYPSYAPGERGDQQSVFFQKLYQRSLNYPEYCIFNKFIFLTLVLPLIF